MASEKEQEKDRGRSSKSKGSRGRSASPASALTSAAESLTFHSDNESTYAGLPTVLPSVQHDSKGRSKLGRSNTMTGTKKSTASSKWGYGWGVGRKDKMKEAEAEFDEKSSSQVDLPHYQQPQADVSRQNSRATQSSRATHETYSSSRSGGSGSGSRSLPNTPEKSASLQRGDSTRTKSDLQRGDSMRTLSRENASLQRGDSTRTTSSRSTAPKPRRPLLAPQDSTSTLVGSAYERKINDTDSIPPKPDTTDRLEQMRRLMAKDNLDYYIIPSEDAHGSEYVAAADKRREFISGHVLNLFFS